MSAPTPSFSSLALDGQPPPDWTSVTVEAMPSGLPTDPRYWAQQVFAGREVPRLVLALLAVRQLLVPLVGIERAPKDVFAVETVVGDEALIVEREGHLDFRCGVGVDAEAGLLRVTTAVWLHGRRGRLYFLPVSVAHDPVTRSMMRAAIRGSPPVGPRDRGACAAMGEDDPVTSLRTVTLLGSTGSIGTQAIEIVRANPDRFRVTGLSAGGGQLDLLMRQAQALQVPTVAVARGTVDEVQAALEAVCRSAGDTAYQPEVLVGDDASTRLAGRPVDVVLNGITGAIGLRPTLAALEAGSTLALANKESLIIGGPLVKAVAKPGQIVPVDSEHSAIAQCLRGGSAAEVRRLVVTASGGPFLGRPRAALHDVTREQALAHPNFAMGPVVTTNSATLVNKGLEVIEAHLLFDIPFERIDVVVHPQQMVHSMVEFTDGSTIAQVSPPSMLIPIAMGMAWPHRVPGAGPACDWTWASTWEFLPLDDVAFPAVALAKRAGAAGGTAPAVFNAVNEVCVEAFLAGRIRFTEIVDTVSHVVEEHLGDTPSRSGIDSSPLDVDDVLAADARARARARILLDLPEGGR